MRGLAGLVSLHEHSASVSADGHEPLLVGAEDACAVCGQASQDLRVRMMKRIGEPIGNYGEYRRDGV